MIRRWLWRPFDRAYTLVQRLRFRYDFFISYSRRDAVYAEHLFNELRRLDFHCFIDREEVSAGDVLKETLRRALDSSAYMTVVGSSDAVASRYVGFEIEHFAITGRRMIPIDIGGVLSTAPWPALKDAVWIDESRQALERGSPTPLVLTSIEKVFELIKRNVRVRLTIAGTTLLFVATVAVAVNRISVATSRLADERAKVEAAEESSRQAAAKAVEERRRADGAVRLANTRLQRAETAEREARTQQDIAHRNIALADERLLEMKFEEGRLELVGRRPPQALIYLNDVYQRRPHDEAVRFLVRAAANGLELRLPDSASAREAEWNEQGNRILTIGPVPALRSADGTVLHQFTDPETDTETEYLEEGERAAEWRGRFCRRGAGILMSSGTGVSLWESGAGLHIRDFQALADVAVESIAVSSEGSKALIVSESADVFLLDIESGQVIWKFGGYARKAPPGMGIASFLGDGRSVVITYAGGSLRIYDSQTLAPPKDLAGADGFAAVTASADGRYVLGLSADRKRVVAWEQKSGWRIGEVTSDGEFTTAVIAPNGRHFAVATAQGVDVFPVPTAPPVPDRSSDQLRVPAAYTLKGHFWPAAEIAFSPDGRKIVTSGRDQLAILWDVSTGERLATIPASGLPMSLTFRSDGRKLLATLPDVTCIWDVQPDLRAETLLDTEGEHFLAVSDDSRFVAWPTEKGVVTIRDVVAGSTWTVPFGTRMPTSLQFSSDGTRLLAADDNTVHLIDLRMGNTLRTFHHESKEVRPELGSPFVSFARDAQARMTRDGRYVLTFDDRQIDIHDAATGERETGLSITTRIESLVVSPTSDAYAFLMRFLPGVWKILVWSIGPHRTSRELLEAHGTAFWMSRNGKLIAVRSAVHTGEQEQLTIYRIVDRGVVSVLSGYPGRILSARFDADGTRVITAGSDGVARIWSVNTGKQLRVIGGDASIVVDAELSPGGDRAVTAEGDANLRLWDVRRGVLLYTLKGHRNRLDRVWFTDDGEKVVSLSHGVGGAELIVWDAGLESRKPSEIDGLVRNHVPARVFTTIGREGM